MPTLSFPAVGPAPGRPFTLSARLSYLVAGVLMLAASSAPVAAQDAAGKQLPAELAVIPRDAFAFLYVRPGELWQCEPAAKLRKAFPLETALLLKSVGEDPMETESFVVVFSSPRSMASLFPNAISSREKRFRTTRVAAINEFGDIVTEKLPEKKAAAAAVPHPMTELLFIETTVKPFDRAQVLERVLGKGAVAGKHQNRTYYTRQDPTVFMAGAVHFVNDRTYLFSFTTEVMKKTLAGLDRPDAVRPLHAALELARQKHQVVLGVDAEHADAARLRKELAADWGMPFRGGSMPTWAMVPLLEMRSAAVAVDLDRDMQLRAELAFPDARRAAKASAALQDAMFMARFLVGAAAHSRRDPQRLEQRDDSTVIDIVPAHLQRMDGQLLVLLDVLLPQLEKGVRKAVFEQRQAVLNVHVKVPIDLEALHELDFRGDFACIHIRVADIMRTESAGRLLKMFPQLQQDRPLHSLAKIGLPIENLESATIVMPSSRQIFHGLVRSRADVEEIRRLEEMMIRQRMLELREEKSRFEELKKKADELKKPEDPNKSEEKNRFSIDATRADVQRLNASIHLLEAEIAAMQEQQRHDFLPDDAVIVRVSTIKPYDRGTVIKGILGEAKEFKHGDKSYFMSAGKRFRSEGVHFIDERNLLIVSMGTAMPIVLDRPDLFRARRPLASAVEAAKKKHHLVVGLNLTEASVLEVKRQLELELLRAGERGASLENELARAVLPLLDARSLVIVGDAGKDVRVQANVAFASPQQAAERRNAVHDALDIGRLFLLARGWAELRAHAQNMLENDRDPGPLVFGDAVLIPGERPVLIPQRDLRPPFFVSGVLVEVEESVRKATLEQQGATLSIAAEGRFDVSALAASAMEEALALVKNDEPDRRVRNSATNLRRMVEAMHAYHDVHGKFPASDKLSWRVQLLPYLDELALYQDFRQNEPWDSEHNLKLLPRMPKIFAPPGVKTKEPFTTHYQMFTGPGTVFDPGKKFEGADGIAIVEAFAADAWTKPSGLVYDAKKPLPKLGGIVPDGFHVAFLSGGVRFLREPVDEVLLRPLFIIQKQRKDFERFDK